MLNSKYIYNVMLILKMYCRIIFFRGRAPANIGLRKKILRKILLKLPQKPATTTFWVRIWRLPRNAGVWKLQIMEVYGDVVCFVC